MSLFGVFERRATIESPSYPLTSTTLLDWMAGPRVDSGIVVNTQTALAYSAVFRCTALISGVCSALPLNAYQSGTFTTAPAPLLKNPHPDMTPVEIWRLIYAHKCLWGNSYVQKIRDNVGRVQQLWPVTPERVQVGKIRPSDLNPSGKVFAITDDWGVVQPRTSREIMHLPGLGYDGITGVSPIRMAAQGIGIALAAERYAAKLFASGNLLSGLLQTEQRLKEGDAQRMQARWREMMSGLDRAHDVAVLDSGAKFQSLTMPNDDAELLKSREFQVLDIARYYGVPPFLMMLTERSTSWGTALEQQALAWLKFSLLPDYLVPSEQRVTKELTVSGTEAKYDTKELTRGDSVARAAYYQAARSAAWMNVDEIRAMEDMPPLPDGKGQAYDQPLNSVVTAAGQGGPGGGANDGAQGDPASSDKGDANANG